MKFFGRRSDKPVEPEPQRPRLLGCTEPHYSNAAKEAFLDVIMKASDAQRPGRIGADHGTDLDRASELEAAIKVASLCANDELRSRMLAFRDAVIELTMGGGSLSEVTEARMHFTAGCREALGTDK